MLARKYRPADFRSLIGQEPMVRTLTNAFASGRIAQAWMLTGVRGVGKTTTARILARALNYKTATVNQPSIELDEIGEHCRAIMEGRHVDVVEMDAASHTGIDDIREIIEQVRYAPVSARYKVYIIDEVHMLSTQAFNGLLKTLEEPPPHVKFIFATTEIRKVPITVLSRCQRFDLRRIDAELLIGHLARIAALEAVEVDDASLAMIARAAEGSARDCLSIFDQAIAHGDGKVSADAVRQMLGLGDRGRVVDLFEHLMKGDAAAALARVPRPVRCRRRPGDDPHRPRRIHASGDAAALRSGCRQGRIAVGRRAQPRHGVLAVAVAARAVAHLADAAQGHSRSAGREPARQRRRDGADPHRACRQSADAGRGAEIAGRRRGEAGRSRRRRAPPLPAGSGNGVSAVSETRVIERNGGGQTMRLVEAEPAAAPALPQEEPQPVVEAVPVTSLADIAALADANRDMAFKVLLKRCVRLVRIEPGRLDVNLIGDAPKTLLGDLTVKLKAWTGRNWMVSLSREEGGATLAELEASKRETAILDAKSDPAVASILARFPGARVIDVRIPNAPEADAPDDGPVPDPAAEDDDLN